MKKRKIEDGDYEISDDSGRVIGRIQEWGNKWYRWHVVPADKSIKGWDATVLHQAALDLEREAAITQGNDR